MALPKQPAVPPATPAPLELCTRMVTTSDGGTHVQIILMRGKNLVDSQVVSLDRAAMLDHIELMQGYVQLMDSNNNAEIFKKRRAVRALAEKTTK
jgi:hypothetical protein